MSKTVIPDLTLVLAGTEFEDKTENYKKFLAQSKIVTIIDLENCPRYAGPNLCGHSTYKFIEHVRQYTLNPPPPPPPPPKSKKATKKKEEPIPEEVISEPEPEAEPADDILLEEDAHITEEGD